MRRTYFKKKFFDLNATTILIGFNIISFPIFSILMFYGQISLDFIAIKPLNIFQGRYLWTFLTSMFMHGSIFHLLVNMFSLFFLGSLVERILGKNRYILFYFVAGIFAALFFVFMSLIFPGDLGSYAVGASGAIFGMIGLLMFLTPDLPVYIMLIPIPIKMKYAAPGMLIALWAISVLPSAFGGQQIPIGNTAHLGGFLAGTLYGVYLKRKYKNKTLYIRKYFS